MSPARERLIAIENGELLVQMSGTGPPLVLIHGMATDHRLWTPQVNALAAYHQVISYDMRGFGGSSRPEGPYRAEDDLALLLTQLDLPPVHLLGLSLGSSVATRFALAYPQLTRSLMVAGPVVQGFSDAEDFMQALKNVWAIAREQGVETAKLAWLKLPLFTGILKSAEWSNLGRQMFNDYDGWHWLNRDPEIWPEIMPAERLAEISAPTLVITGAEEIPGLVRAGAFMTDQISTSSAVTLDAAGHVVNLEQPEVFNRLVTEFLAHLSAD